MNDKSGRIVTEDRPRASITDYIVLGAIVALMASLIGLFT